MDLAILVRTSSNKLERHLIACIGELIAYRSIDGMNRLIEGKFLLIHMAMSILYPRIGFALSCPPRKDFIIIMAIFGNFMVKLYLNNIFNILVGFFRSVLV